MDGMLSQDEINALLSGMDISGGSDNGDTHEISDYGQDTSVLLTDVEKDAIGEVANISMGSSATTLYSLVNRKVSITTPAVKLAQWDDVATDYERPCVFILIKYTAGLDGSNILVLKEHDVKVIADLMMGGDGTNVDCELGELHLSAISEAMNQMMGSAATSLSTMLGMVIDISPPDATLRDLSTLGGGEDIADFLGGTFVKISFKMQIDDLVDSTLMQLYPIDFAKKLVETFMGTQAAAEENKSEPVPAPAPQQAPEMPQTSPQTDPKMQPQMGMPMGMPQMQPQMGMPQMQPQMSMPQMTPQMGGMTMGMPQMDISQMTPQMQNVNIQPAQFQNFARGYSNYPGQENIGLISDVPLEVTVELGRTTKAISEILDFAPGTIIELDKIAGEPVDVLVNGKFVAKGEVVVIEESFGVRVTEIIK